MTNTNELELEIFRAGNYKDKGSFSESDLEQIANDYNPAHHEAPVTIDHQQSGPAFGWVSALRRKGDRLVARLRDLNEEFLKLLRSGAFKKRSIELYRKFSQTGRPYLRALTFLGARPPEVKGLADITFAEESDYVTIDFAEPEHGSASQVVHPDVLREARDQIQRLQEEKHRAEEELRLLRQSLLRQDILHFFEDLKRQGKFLPAWEKMGILRFMETLSDTETLKFAEDDEEPCSPLQWFRNFLSLLPALVPLQEFAPSEPYVQMSETQMPHPAQRATISQRSVEMHRRVVALRERHPELSYSEALRQILRSS